MLVHVSKTKTLQRFLSTPKHPPDSSGKLIPNNIVPFPSPYAQRPEKGNKQRIPDWKERLITMNQFRYIQILAEQNRITIEVLNNSIYKRYGADLSNMKRIDASDVIQSLKRQL